MLGWLLAGCPPTDLRPGVVVLPRWMTTDDARRLAATIAQLSSDRLPVLELPLTRLLEADPTQRALTRGVIVVTHAKQSLEPELLPQAVVLVVNGIDEPTSLRDLREGLRLSLTRALTRETHPLRLLGAGPWLARLLAERAIEPLDFLDLLEAAVQHRSRYAEHDEEAWQRSVRYAAGTLVARRLLRLSLDQRWPALRALLALPSAWTGAQAADWLGLVAIEGTAIRVLPLARDLREADARGGLLNGLGSEAGHEPLPEDLGAELSDPPTQLALGGWPWPRSKPWAGTLLADATRAWLTERKELADRALVRRGLKALELANRAAHYREDARLPAVGEVVVALRSSPRPDRATEALAELIVLTAAWPPSDEEAQQLALGALHRLYARGVLPPTVWAAALLRRAERLLNGPRTKDPREEAEAALQAVASLPVEGLLLAELLHLQGRLAEERARHDEALTAYNASIAVSRAAGDEHSQANTLNKVADVLQSQGRFDEALQLRLEKVLPVYRRLGDEHSAAYTLGQVADVLQARKQFDEVLRIRGDELKVYRRLGDLHNVAVTLGQIADVHQAQGRSDLALHIRRQEEVPLYERLGDLHHKAVAMHQIANQLRDQGQLEEAMRMLTEEVIPIFERLGDPRESALAQDGVASVLLARGRVDEALNVLRARVLPVFETTGAAYELCVTRANLATALLQRGHPDDLPEAHRLLTSALEYAVQHNLSVEAEHLRSLLARLPQAEAT